MFQKLHCNVKPFLYTFDVKMLENERRAFGQWLQSQIQDSGLTQASIVKKMGLTPQQLSRIINGASGTKRETVIDIVNTINTMSESYKVDLDDALYRAGYVQAGEQKTLPPKLEQLAFTYDNIPDDDIEQADWIIELAERELKRLGLKEKL